VRVAYALMERRICPYRTQRRTRVPRRWVRLAVL